MQAWYWLKHIMTKSNKVIDYGPLPLYDSEMSQIPRDYTSVELQAMWEDIAYVSFFFSLLQRPCFAIDRTYAHMNRNVCSLKSTFSLIFTTPVLFLSKHIYININIYIYIHVVLFSRYTHLIIT